VNKVMVNEAMVARSTNEALARNTNGALARKVTEASVRRVKEVSAAKAKASAVYLAVAASSCRRSKAATATITRGRVHPESLAN
jgi:hypothetical protein